MIREDVLNILEMRRHPPRCSKTVVKIVGKSKTLAVLSRPTTLLTSRVPSIFCTPPN
jgi:hypothetical protein